MSGCSWPLLYCVSEGDPVERERERGGEGGRESKLPYTALAKATHLILYTCAVHEHINKNNTLLMNTNYFI